jgi:hypothetical protein
MFRQMRCFSSEFWLFYITCTKSYCFSKQLYRHVGCGIAHVILTLFNIFKKYFSIKIAYIAKTPHPSSTTYHFSCVAALRLGSRFHWKEIHLKSIGKWVVGFGDLKAFAKLIHYPVILYYWFFVGLHPTHCSVYSCKTRIKPRDAIFTIKEI